MKVSLKNFITDNKFKAETLLSYWYSAVFRLQILLIKPKYLKKLLCRKSSYKALTPP